jgi:hypothetical protein
MHATGLGRIPTMADLFGYTQKQVYAPPVVQPPTQLQTGEI